MPQPHGMRRDVLFGRDGELSIAYYSSRREAVFESPSASVWLIPGTHPDDPSGRPVDQPIYA